jgi:hypothetical protein
MPIKMEQRNQDCTEVVEDSLDLWGKNFGKTLSLIFLKIERKDWICQEKISSIKNE